MIPTHAIRPMESVWWIACAANPPGRVMKIETARALCPVRVGVGFYSSRAPLRSAIWYDIQPGPSPYFYSISQLIAPSLPCHCEPSQAVVGLRHKNDFRSVALHVLLGKERRGRGDRSYRTSPLWYSAKNADCIKLQDKEKRQQDSIRQEVWDLNELEYMGPHLAVVFFSRFRVSLPRACAVSDCQRTRKATLNHSQAVVASRGRRLWRDIEWRMVHDWSDWSPRRRVMPIKSKQSTPWIG